MWKYFGILFVLIGVTIAAKLALQLEPIPEQFKNSKGCYIKELDKMVKVGDSAPSIKECFTYLCEEKQVIVIGCDLVETSPLCKVVENKTLHYPACCPSIHCDTKPVLKNLKSLHVLGFDVLYKKDKNVVKDESKDDKKKLLEIKVTTPSSLPEPLIKEEIVKIEGTQVKHKRFISDLRSLRVLGLDLLNENGKQDTNHNETIITNGIHSVPNVEEVIIPQQPEPTQNGHIDKVIVNDNKNTIINGTGNASQTDNQKIPQLKALRILGQDMLGGTPINLWSHQNGEVAVSPPSIVINNEKENQHKVGDGLRQEDVLVFFKRVGN